jgi:hypothetical protein
VKRPYTWRIFDEDVVHRTVHVLPAGGLHQRGQRTMQAQLQLRLRDLLVLRDHLVLRDLRHDEVRHRFCPRLCANDLLQLRSYEASWQPPLPLI